MVIPFEIHGAKEKVVTRQVVIHQVGIGNRANAKAEGGRPIVTFGSSHFGVSTAWAGAVSSSSPVIFRTDSEVPDSPDEIAELLRREYFIDREHDFVHLELAIAILFFTVEGGKRVHMPTTVDNHGDIPFRVQARLGVVGDFKLAKDLWKGAIAINSWDDLEPLLP